MTLIPIFESFVGLDQSKHQSTVPSGSVCLCRFCISTFKFRICLSTFKLKRFRFDFFICHSRCRNNAGPPCLLSNLRNLSTIALISWRVSFDLSNSSFNWERVERPCHQFQHMNGNTSVWPSVCCLSKGIIDWKSRSIPENMVISFLIPWRSFVTFVTAWCAL